MTEVRELQHEMHHDQRVAASEIVRTKETVERVAEAAARRRRLPRVRLEFPE
jgi:phosphohistidine phosphatase SixA